MNARSDEETGRPEFMTTLGLLPPYTLEDVKSAYREKVRHAHPDRGGAAADFVKLQEAYERALEYVAFCGDRRKWIAVQVECYLRQQEAAAEVARLGGQVEFEEIDWMKRFLGDFASLADQLRIIRLRNTAADDAFVTFLAEQPPRTPYLRELDLAGTCVTDKGLQALARLGLLRRLDLSGTEVTGRGVRAVLEAALPALEEIGLASTRVGWLSRWRLRALLRGRKAENERLKLLGKRLELTR